MSEQNAAVGKLKGTTQIELHSFQATTTLNGRKPTDGKAHISSYFDFSKRFTIIYQAAALEDPFANQSLVILENKFSEVDDHLLNAESASKKYIEQIPEGVSHTRPVSEEPRIFNVPASHYGSMAISRLAQMDRVVLQYLMLMHHNYLPPRKGHAAIRLISRRMRELMECGSAWRFTGVTIKDLTLKTQLSQQAIELLGKSSFINQSILTHQEAIYAYYIKQYETVKPEFGPVAQEAEPETSEAEANA